MLGLRNHYVPRTRRRLAFHSPGAPLALLHGCVRPPTHEQMGVSRDMNEEPLGSLAVGSRQVHRGPSWTKKGVGCSCRADSVSSCDTSWQAPHWTRKKETLASIISLSTKEPSSPKAHNHFQGHKKIPERTSATIRHHKKNKRMVKDLTGTKRKPFN